MFYYLGSADMYDNIIMNIFFLKKKKDVLLLPGLCGHL